MLPYANQMFLDILHEDGLVVAAKGLGVEEVFFNLLKVYSDPGNLVLVIGANEEEEEYFLSRYTKVDISSIAKYSSIFVCFHEKMRSIKNKLTINFRLKQEQVKAVPKKITTEYSATERQRLYLEGGVLFITTRILVVEMLTERIPFGIFFTFSLCQKQQIIVIFFHVQIYKKILLVFYLCVCKKCFKTKTKVCRKWLKL